MKHFFVVVLVAFSLQVSAQTVVPRISNEKLSYLQKYDKYKRMQTRGTVMIVAGGILAIAGISNLGSVTYTTNQYGQQTTNDPRAVSGAFMFLGGVGLLGAGIPLTIIGTKKKHSYERKLDGLVFNLNFAPQQRGLTLSYKF